MNAFEGFTQARDRLLREMLTQAAERFRTSRSIMDRMEGYGILANFAEADLKLERWLYNQRPILEYIEWGSEADDQG